MIINRSAGAVSASSCCMAVQGAASVEGQCAERMALLVLLRSGLWEREPDDLGCFPLSDESWGRLYRLARQQTVTGVVFRGLQHLPDELLPPGPLLLRWAAEVDAIERRNRAVDAAVAELCSKFRANGLEPVLQKGQGVALCYADPALRESGDIDFVSRAVGRLPPRPLASDRWASRPQAMPTAACTTAGVGLTSSTTTGFSTCTIRCSGATPSRSSTVGATVASGCIPCPALMSAYRLAVFACCCSTCISSSMSLAAA